MGLGVDPRVLGRRGNDRAIDPDSFLPDCDLDTAQTLSKKTGVGAHHRALRPGGQQRQGRRPRRRRRRLRHQTVQRRPNSSPASARSPGGPPGRQLPEPRSRSAGGKSRSPTGWSAAPKAPSRYGSPRLNGSCKRSWSRTPETWSASANCLQEVWGPHYGSETNYLRQYMAQLRHKLEDDPSHPRHLLTEPDMGYRLHLNDSGQLTEA